MEEMAFERALEEEMGGLEGAGEGESERYEVEDIIRAFEGRGGTGGIALPGV